MNEKRKEFDKKYEIDKKIGEELDDDDIFKTGEIAVDIQ